jgi:3-oxoacyl-[acyl-carrier protein] reductase
MKTVLITGGSRGIGRALVEEFYKNSYRVAFFYLNSTEKAREITNEYPDILSYRCDVRNEGEVVSTVSDILRELKSVDVLINNAGVSYEGLLTDMSISQWNDVISSNLSSAFLMCRQLVPHFVSKKSGKIINISSMWGKTGASCEVAYSASKAGLDGFTKALAKELAPSNITVNAIAPGVINTDMLSSFSEDDINVLKDMTPLGRLGTGIDVARAALFLASDSADFITGEIINVNGGFVI